jgi:O-antigen biosynthesis protein
MRADPLPTEIRDLDSLSGFWSSVKRRLRLRNRQRLWRRELARCVPYVDWVTRHDVLDERTRQPLLPLLSELRSELSPGPEFVLHMPLAGASLEDVRASCDALRAQWYGRWRCVFSGSPNGDVTPWLREAAGSEPRFVLDTRDATPHADAEAWIGTCAPGERWREHALALIALAIAHHRGALLIYGDHDHIAPDGQRSDPVFKPDWNADLLLACDWVQTPLIWQGAHHARLMASGASAPRGPHDLLLRGTASVDASRLVHVPHVLVHRPAPAPVPESDAAAVQAHLAAIDESSGGSARAEATPLGVRVRFAVPTPAPRASLIVPTRNGLHLLRPCIESLLAKTRYPDFEIVIVDNGSDDPPCLRYLESLARRRMGPRVHVRRDGSPFNFAALNNDALVDCTGSVLALVNNDIEVIDDDWLREMVSLALRPGVGAVGARLLHTDGSVQHAGVVLGIAGAAGHALRWWPGDAAGPQNRLQQMREVSAVTAACLVVQRQHYEAVGGMDAAQFPVAFNDVDFCLRLRERGLRNVYTPHALLFHHESATRGSDRDGKRRARFEAERARFVARWGEALREDPAYNPNLSLDNELVALAEPPRLALHEATTGCGAGAAHNQARAPAT